jgi:Lanthionine synthetase C-like protein
LRYEDIDSGVCGVILFLIDLYKSRKSQFYLDTLMEAGNELITHCKENARSHFGFFKGRAGVCFTFMKLSELTDNEIYLNFALEIMRGDSDYFIDSEFATNRLYDGRSGLLIVLLHMYCLRPEEWILDKMQHCLKKIVADFIPTRNGIVWNRNDYNIKPLISYLYGSSGLVFALTQYGNYFGNGLIIKLAKDIAVYEDHFITRRLSCWPDFRNKMTTAKEFEDQRKRFSANEKNFFPKPKLNYDFENGIAGISLSRFALRDLGRKDISGEHVNPAIENLGHFTTDDMSIINGITGVGENLLISTKYLDNPDVSKRFEMIADRVASNDFSTRDITLFTGVTGVAYFLLHSENPETAGSVLFPKVNQNDSRKSALHHERLNPDYVSCIFRSCFPYTSLTAELSLPLVLSDINFTGFEKSGTTLAKFISERFLSLIENIPARVKEIVKDIYNLESSKLKLLSEAKSNSIYFIKRIHEFEKKTILLNMSDDELKSQTLIFKNETKALKTRWNWANLDQPGANAVLIIKEIISSPPGKFRIILYRERSIIAENLNTIGSLTKSIFKNHRKVCDALEDYVEAIEYKNESERVKIKSYAMANIKYFVRKSLLVQED